MSKDRGGKKEVKKPKQVKAKKSPNSNNTYNQPIDNK